MKSVKWNMVVCIAASPLHMLLLCVKFHPFAHRCLIICIGLAGTASYACGFKEGAGVGPEVGGALVQLVWGG